MNPIIPIDENFVSSSLAYVGQLFTDTQLLVILVIGIPLAFWIITKVIGLAVGRTRGRRA
jgi:hypothetical protein